ncbi:sensor histidine kinase [Paenibacillus sp. YPG26]|uniref:sensor histidine kinase n=1 Tax=Paenibacillus sp. YPG26 TaxID=2878915 RepID=UPI00203E6D37|nr:sensor histidine kinase [Paenibacillus sp. YPG26]USB33003.1 sensor histidine kinase [Paenibacillus sp. YPG26]
MFKKMNIQTKLMSLLLLATVVPAGISLTASYLYTKASVTEKSINENTKLLTLGGTNLSNYFSGINQLALSVYSGINLPNSLFTVIQNTRPADPMGRGHELTDNRDIIASQLYNLFQSNQDIYQLHLFIRANQQSNTLIKGIFHREKNPGYVPLRDNTGRNRPFLEPTHLDHRYGLKYVIPNLKSETTEVFSVHYPIYRTPSNEVMANLSIDFKLSELREITKSMFTLGTEKLYLVNEDHKVLYTSEQGQHSSRLTAGWSSIPEDKNEGYFYSKDENFGGIVFFKRITGPLFTGTLIKLVPYDHLYSDARHITEINAVIGLFFLIIGVCAAVWISIRFTTPIKRLISYTQKVQIGQLDARIDMEAEDEFGILARKMTAMTKTINDLILTEYRLELANKTNQLKALQAQINPHFLYNALQSIASMSLRYNAPKVYDQIYSLGSMMRYTMATGKTEVTLQEELEHVENYLQLQKGRFGDENLTVILNISEETRRILVPKMILQPIVENIFKHGFKEGIKDGRIAISSTISESGDMRITVSDNGTGMPEDPALTQGIESAIIGRENDSSESIGLSNVLARLQLYFGEESSIGIVTNEVSGVTVTLAFPIGKLRGDLEEGGNDEGSNR